MRQIVEARGIIIDSYTWSFDYVNNMGEIIVFRNFRDDSTVGFYVVDLNKSVNDNWLQIQKEYSSLVFEDQKGFGKAFTDLLIYTSNTRDRFGVPSNKKQREKNLK